MDDGDGRIERPYWFAIFGLGRGPNKHYEYMKEYHFPDALSAARSREAIDDTQHIWGRYYRDVEISPISGPDMYVERQTPETFQRGMAMVREMLAGCDGPLSRDLGKRMRVTTSVPDWQQDGYNDEVIDEDF